MKKWYDEEYEFTIEVTGFLHGDRTESLGPGDGYYVAPDEIHGCACLEEGILIDTFSPVRADFLGL